MDKLSEGFQDLPQYIKEDIIDRLVNPPLFLPIWFMYGPLVGIFNEIGKPDWFSYMVIPMGHDLYETDDEDAPDIIKDRNGEVVLGLCRRCGRAEIELSELCK